jgi:hypothetical protein
MRPQADFFREVGEIQDQQRPLAFEKLKSELENDKSLQAYRKVRLAQLTAEAAGKLPQATIASNIRQSTFDLLRMYIDILRGGLLPDARQQLTAQAKAIGVPDLKDGDPAIAIASKIAHFYEEQTIRLLKSSASTPAALSPAGIVAPTTPAAAGDDDAIDPDEAAFSALGDLILTNDPAQAREAAEGLVQIATTGSTAPVGSVARKRGERALQMLRELGLMNEPGAGTP